MRILIVDDEPVNRLVLSRKLREWGHDVVQAKDGSEAWGMMQREPFRMVITDWVMPEMDGIELTRLIRDAGFPGYVYVLLLTARTGIQSIVEGMDAGADDFMAKPFDVEELHARLRAGERVLRLESDLAERNRSLGEAYASARRDLESAADMQRALLPSPGVHYAGLRMAWRFLPASVVAGDVFNLVALDEHRTGFWLLDVAGHGVPSAMLSFTLSMTLSPAHGVDGLLRRVTSHAPFYEITPPREVLGALNERFQDDSDSLRYFTMIYGVVDTKLDTLTLAQAGHPAPVLVSGGTARRVDAPGFPVGMMPNMDFEEVTVPFGPGDRLLLYSDGVTECANAERQQFQLDRLERVVAGCSAESLDASVGSVESALRAWRGSPEFQDDVSLLAIERIAA